MSEPRKPSPSAADRTDLVGPETDGGMRVPDGMNALVQALPSSIPPEMFDETPRPPPAVIVPVARPAKPDPHGAVTAQMPVMELPPECIASVPPGPVLPASVDGIVVTPAHEEREELEAITPPASETVEIPGLDRRRWSRVTAMLVVGAVACVLLAAGLSRPKVEPAASNGPATSSATPVTGPEPTGEPAPPSAPVTVVAVAAPVVATDGAEPVAAPAAAPGKGLLSTSASTPGRRIFVDDRAVGETPAAVAVPCGLHRVRVGSRGKTMTVDVPCEGEVGVSDR